MSERNDLLRTARESRESPSSPGNPLTRKDLADLVNQQVYRATGKETAIDANHVGKMERGVVRWPAAHYRAALRVILNATTDAELGFARAGKPQDVDRKTFLRAALGVGAGTLVAGGSRALADSDELATSLAGATQHYRRMESMVSSEALFPPVEAHLRLATDVVHNRLRTGTGFGVLSEIAGLAAWLAADRGDTAMARRRYADSIRYAESAGHPLLVSYMTASLGHFAVECGDVAYGVRLLRRAGGYFDSSAPASAHAWLSSLSAVAHASNGDSEATFAALRSAEKMASLQRGEPQWPWVFPFTAAKVARYQSSALARLGDLRASEAAFVAAGPALSSPKPRALSQIEHARVLAGAGRVDEACGLVTEAVGVGREYGSERIMHQVRVFRGGLPDGSIEATRLDGTLSELYSEVRR